MKTTASLFTGGGLVEVGARSAGLVPLWGIEIDDAIAQVARVNGLHVITADARQVDPGTLQRPDHLHSSPKCQSFSSGKTDGEETREDIQLAEATVHFVEALLPRVFTLENVSMYRFSKSWKLIQDALDRLGYWMHVENHLNCADFGVPQTRKRMIVRAVRGGWLPPLPQPVPWRGWYAAIEDLLPGLPDSEFAPWQLARMPQELLDQSRLFSQGSFRDGDTLNVTATQPAFTVTANRNMNSVRAFIMPGSGNTNFAEAHPGKGCRYEDEPMHTVTCQNGGGTWPKAFIVDCQTNKGKAGLTIRDPHEPCFTITASANKRTVRAFIVDSQNAGQDAPTIRNEADPTFTVTSNMQEKGMPRALVPGRVVKMTPRPLARFQSIPDDYILPDNDVLAVRIIGNAVPPLLTQRLLEPFV